MITKEEFAARLNGRPIGDEITSEECDIAKRLGFVVLYGASDDLAEFRGAIDDESGCYDGGTLFVTPAGPLVDHERRCECEFCGYEAVKAKAKRIEALWCKDDCSWQYTTDIPHATFEIVEGEDKYCRGIVFHISDL